MVFNKRISCSQVSTGFSLPASSNCSIKKKKIVINIHMQNVFSNALIFHLQSQFSESYFHKKNYLHLSNCLQTFLFKVTI